jgi:hypothetical protein
VDLSLVAREKDLPSTFVSSVPGVRRQNHRAALEYFYVDGLSHKERCLQAMIDTREAKSFRREEISKHRFFERIENDIRNSVLDSTIFTHPERRISMIFRPEIWSVRYLWMREAFDRHF